MSASTVEDAANRDDSIAAIGAPAGGGRRILSLDVLRGFALLGILVVNIQSFAMIEAAYFNPTAYGDLSGANYLVWALTYALADQKMMTIFGMLFGAGIVLMADNRERSGRSPAAAHFRRMLALLLFGLFHAYVIWHGDILVTYALCGMAAFPFRRLRPAVLLPIGLAVIAVAAALFLLSGWSVRYWPPEAVAEIETDLSPSSAVIEEELATYRGSWRTQMSHRAPAAFEFQTFVFAFWGFWRALGLMLIGMALFKLGVFSAARSATFYLALVGIGLLVGIPIVAYGAYRSFQWGWGSIESFFLGALYNYWGSLLVALGWVGVVMLLCRAGPRAAFTAGPLAAVGRLALSNYLLQSVICTLLYYGHGLGLFGRVERTGQLLIVLAMWAVQLMWSPIYLRHYSIGPAEWLWRTVTYLTAPRVQVVEAGGGGG